MNDPRGSVWRKWDLHFHTPSSYDYGNKSRTNQEIIEAIAQNGLSVVAITDHHNIDIDRISEMKSLGEANKITILPGIEMRTDKGGSEAIHIIGIFGEGSEIGSIWEKIKGKLELTKVDLDKKGDEKISCNLEKTCDLIHELGGVVSIHAGKKKNSLENITNTLSYKEAIKLDILQHIDIFEMGKESDIKEYQEKVFPNIPKHPPMIICSDNHDCASYGTKATLWVKADPTFEGLKQIIREPYIGERVYIGPSPKLFDRVNGNRTKYIRELAIQKSPDSELDEIWFEGFKLVFTHELCAIIGNKGNGKSAILDIIGLLGNSRNYQFFTFLNEDKFLKLDKARNFTASIIWESGDSNECNLGDAPDILSPERVKYIPQNFFERLCNEREAEFESELKEVIYSHVMDDEKFGLASLDELIEYKSESILKGIEDIKEEIAELNSKIIDMEQRGTDDFRRSIEEKYKLKKEELESHLKSIPKTVPEPASSTAIKEEMKEINESLAKKKKEREVVIDLIKDNRAERAELRQKLIRLENFQQELEALNADYERVKSEYGKFLEEIGTPIETLITFLVNKQAMEDRKGTLNTQINDISASLDENTTGSPVSKEKALNVEIEELQGKLDEPNRRYQEYLDALREWQEKKEIIEGSEDEEGTLKYYEAVLKYLKEELENDLSKNRETRLALSERLYQKKNQVLNTYRTYYKPVEDFIKGHEELAREYKISLDVSFKVRNFEEDFLDHLDRKAKGTFCGKDESQAKLAEMVKGVNFNDYADIKKFLGEIVNCLEKDRREGHQNEKRVIERQIRQGKYLDFYNFLFFLDYLEPVYELKLFDKEITQLSPGEKGALLLVFYLFLDQDDVPLVMDQPEENLDNQSVFEILVPFIKKAKQRRQIILVTHNPNIGVVCDAEQIINVRIDKARKHKVTTICGAIENPEINEKIVEILEGTMPAFDNRDKKYEFTKKKFLEKSFI